MGKTRLWAFTNFDLNFNYDDFISNTTAEYVFIGQEICPKTKRQHHQGFVYFSGARGSCKQVAKQLGKCHVEPCKGNIDQNIDYCSKDGNYIEYGVKPAQGHRTDLCAIKDDILEQKLTVNQIIVNNPVIYHQYGRTLNKLEEIALRSKYRTWMTEGIWYYGPTGVGKSHMAFKDYSPDTHYIYPNDNGWWDGYTGQETVIINEFRGGICFAELLDLMDKWPKHVKRRNREPLPFLAKKIIITSSLHPKEVYKYICKDESDEEEDSSESVQQLYRRCKIVKMEQKWSKGNTEL